MDEKKQRKAAVKEAKVSVHFSFVATLMHSGACIHLLKFAFAAQPHQSEQFSLLTAAEGSSDCQEGAENHVQGRGRKTAQTHGCTPIIYCPFRVTFASTVEFGSFQMFGSRVKRTIECSTVSQVIFDKHDAMSIYTGRDWTTPCS